MVTEYKTVAIIHRKGETISFFLKEGETLNAENIVDVHVDPQTPEKCEPEIIGSIDEYQILGAEYLKSFEHWEIGSSEKLSVQCFCEWVDRQMKNIEENE